MHITTHLDIDLVALDQADEVTCLLELAAPSRSESNQRPGRTLMLVLDRSGSMAGAPLDAAKDAIARLVRQLAPHDCFGLVTFDDQAEVVIPPMLMADHELEPMQRAVAAITPGGRTDLSAGYLLAMRQTRRAVAASGHAGATVLIVSDGHANGGITDPTRLGQVATKALADGIVTSTLGLGLGYDEILLDTITRAGNGTHRFAPDIDTAMAEMQRSVTDLLDVSVLAATIRICPQGDAIDRIRIRQELATWSEPGAIVVNVGDLYAGEERKLLIAFDVPAVSDLGTCTIAEISIDFTSVADLAEHHVLLPVTVNVVPGDQARDRVRNPVVEVERLIADADDAKKAAIQAVRDDRGDLAGEALLSALDVLDELRCQLLPSVDAAVMARLDASSEDLRDLRDGVLGQPAAASLKAMTDSLAATSRGRKARKRSA